MNRRLFLAAFGAALTSIAGCTASTLEAPRNTDPDSSSETLTSSPSEYPTSRENLDTFDPDRKYKQVEIGSRADVQNPENNKPHNVEVWNATSEPYPVTIRIREQSSGATPLDTTDTIPTDASVLISLLEPSDYLVELQSTTTEARDTLRIPTGFDCNNSQTSVGLFEGGRIKSSVVTWLVNCTTSTATDESPSS